jgi:PBSX family phage terminase large subunit
MRFSSAVKLFRAVIFILLLVAIMAPAVIIQATPDSAVGFQCFGAAREFWAYKGPEALLSGPYETGKTMSALNKFHTLHAKYPKSQGLMVRKTYQSLLASAVVTFEKKVLPVPPDDPKSQVDKFGGNRPEWYDYPNGSRIVLGGMDNPDKFLSAEYDWIYVNQAEELSLDDWEKLTGRATGRAGNTPYTQVIADCNPGAPQHWILARPRLKIFYSRHEDNPTLYDQQTKQITKRGEKTIETLDALTGVRYKRGRLGLWVAAEGQVYEEFDPAIHLINRFDIPAEWRRIRLIDFGYTNPFTCLWVAIDPDGRMFLYREIYMTQRLVEDHARDIVSLSEEEHIEATIADHDAEDRATLEKHGVPTIKADKAITVGIQAFQARLRKAGDGKSRFYVMRDSLVETDAALKAKFKPISVVEEFAVYVWATTKDGKPDKETPVDNNNHGLDAARYGVMYLDNRKGEMQQANNPFFGDSESAF